MRLKMGPFELRTGGKPQKMELGATGNVFFAGQLTEEEYNHDLVGEKAIKVFDRMRRSDGQVKGALLACTLPLREARWDIESASDSAQDREIAAFVRDNLFDQMTMTWDDFLSHALLMLPFGFSIFEKVWELVDGKYRWRKLAPRLQKTLYKWEMDPDGGLKGIVQYAQKEGMFKQIDIPVEKLLVFTNDKEGSNFQGTSLLRAAYKHWYYKDQLYKIDGIAAERHGVGIAVFTLPSGATTEGTDSDLGRVSKIGESLHTHERSYVALPDGYAFNLTGVAGQLHNIIGSIDHHNREISKSILTQFMDLGSTDVGSYAMSRDQSGFFLMALRAVGKNICSVMNRYAIRQLVDYNWDVKAYPKLTVSGLVHRDLEQYSKAVTGVVNAGLIMPDADIEIELRKFLHLPPRKQAEKGGEFKMKEFSPTRNPRGCEVYVAFNDIYEKLNTSEESFIQAAKKIQDVQIAKVVDMVIEDIEKGELDKVVAIDIPLRSQMSDAIEKVLVELFKYGQDQVKEELQKQGKELKAQEPGEGALMGLDAEAIKKFLKTRARATSHVLGSKLRAAMAWEALRQIKGGVINKPEMLTALTSLSDRELELTAKFSVSEAFNLGRQSQAKEQEDEIDHVEYSALMDTNTCGPCSALDGKSFPFPSADWDAAAPPLKDCEGKDRCRCVGVFVYKSERK